MRQKNCNKTYQKFNQFDYNKMTYNIKCYVFILALIVLGIDFGDREKTIFVDGRPEINVVKHSDVNVEETQKVDPQDFSNLDYDDLKKVLEERRNVNV